MQKASIMAEWSCKIAVYRTPNYKCFVSFFFSSFYGGVSLFAKHVYYHSSNNVLRVFTNNLRMTLTNLKTMFLLLGDVLCF